MACRAQTGLEIPATQEWVRVRFLHFPPHKALEALLAMLRSCKPRIVGSIPTESTKFINFSCYN